MTITHYYLPNSGGNGTGPYIKEAQFFMAQVESDHELAWHLAWRPIHDAKTIEHARQLARELMRAKGSSCYPYDVGHDGVTTKDW